MSAIQKILSKHHNNNPIDPLIEQNSPSWIDNYNIQNKITSTLSRWPPNPELKKQINVPLCLTLKPFQDIEIEKASFSKEQLMKYRCFACKAFINKLCIFKNNKQYDCSICGTSNILEKQFNVESPEFKSMIYEADASQDHSLKISTPPTIILVIDVSKRSFQNGYITNLNFALKEYLKRIQNKQFFQIMIITYDKNVHYYDLSSNDLTKIIICDEEDIQKSIEILSRVQDKIVQILDSLEEVSQNNDYRNDAILKAIEFAYSASRFYSGRILIFSSLQKKLTEIKHTGDPSKMHLIENHRYLERRFSKQLKQSYMSLSFFIFGQHYVDLMSFYMLTKLSNGSLHHYTKNNSLKFYYDLSTLLFQQDRYEVVLKVRYSPGIRLIGIFGAYTPTKTIDQINLTTCSPTQNYTFQFNVEGKINSPYIAIQYTLLFTDYTGQRKFRVINYIVQMEEKILKILDSIDYSALNYYYIKAGSQSLDGSLEPKTIRKILEERCTQHIKYNIEQREGKIIKDLTQYTTVSYSFVRSKLLNLPYSQSLQYDILAESRSVFLRLGYNQVLLRIFPLLYGINSNQIDQQQQDNYEESILDLNEQCSKKYSIIVVDKGDELQVYMNNKDDMIVKIFGDCKNLLERLSEQYLNSLQVKQIKYLMRLIQRLRSEKETNFEKIKFVENIREYLIFDQKGIYSYANFINKIMK